MNRDRELLLRSLDGDLSTEESSILESSLAQNGHLRDERDRLLQIRDMLSDTGASSFSEGFAIRVMQRVWEVREASRGAADSVSSGLYDSLRWMFVRVAPACLVLAIGIGIYSGVIADGSLSSSLVESILGLPEASLDTALFLASM